MTTINEFHAKANAFFRGGPARARALEATARALEDKLARNGKET